MKNYSIGDLADLGDPLPQKIVFLAKKIGISTILQVRHFVNRRIKKEKENVSKNGGLTELDIDSATKG